MMAKNFVYEVRDTSGYYRMFPQIDVKAVLGDLADMPTLQLTIPAGGANQSINVSALTADLASAPFDVFLLSGKEDDYNTIFQIETSTGKVDIQRLYADSRESIDVLLVFYVETQTA